MVGSTQPPSDDYVSPGGVIRDPSPDDPPPNSAAVPESTPIFEHRGTGYFKCKPEDAVRNNSQSIEELYQNITNIYTLMQGGTSTRLKVRDDPGTVVVDRVREIVAGCMHVEDLGGDTARITPKTAQPFQAPAGGIGAMTTSTMPSATCTLLQPFNGVLYTTTQTATVYNIGPTAVSANAIFLAHPVVPGCVYLTMSCCETTGITLPSVTTGPGGGPGGGSGGGGGGGTDPPAEVSCEFCNGGTAPHQYDLEFNGFYKLVPAEGAPTNCCNYADLVTDPYTIRLTAVCPDGIPMGTPNCDGPTGFPFGPCSSIFYPKRIEFGCLYRGFDYSPEFVGEPTDPRFETCGPIIAEFGWMKVGDDATFAELWTGCGQLFNNDDRAGITPDNYKGFYLWAQLIIGQGGTGGTIPFYSYGFYKRLNSDPSTSPSCAFSGEEINIATIEYGPRLPDLEAQYQVPNGGGFVGRCPVPWPREWSTLNPGNTYVSVTGVDTGGILSI